LDEDEEAETEAEAEEDEAEAEEGEDGGDHLPMLFVQGATAGVGNGAGFAIGMTGSPRRDDSGAGVVIACPFAGCGKVFNHAVNRTMHVRRVHTFHKPHKCDFEGCGKVRFVVDSEPEVKATSAPMCQLLLGCSHGQLRSVISSS
jgi:hypothetical protein